MSLNGPEVITMDRRKCPRTGETCWGSECALWMRYDRQDGRAFEACADVLAAILQEQVIIEQMRTQASADKVATNITNGFGGLLALAARAQARLPKRVAVVEAEVMDVEAL